MINAFEGKANRNDAIFKDKNDYLGEDFSTSKILHYFANRLLI